MTEPKPLTDEQLRTLHRLVRSLRLAGYTDTEITEYMRRNFPPKPPSRKSGPSDRTFPSRQQINETPDNGGLIE